MSIQIFYIFTYARLMANKHGKVVTYLEERSPIYSHMEIYTLSCKVLNPLAPSVYKKVIHIYKTSSVCPAVLFI